MIKNKKLKIGLALGSGGTRGLAHIGVLKVLEENNIPIDFIAGSSIGALVGGFYASGMSVEKIEQIALEANWKQMFSLIDFSFSGSGLVEGEKVKKFIENYVENIYFKDCKIPFKAVATDLKDGKAIVLDIGEISKAIRASISVPLFFKPVKIESKLLADGGLSNPVPVDVVRDMGADIIIAVNINSNYLDDSEKENPNIYTIAENSIKILNQHLASYNTLSADIIIEPAVSNTKWNEFVKGERLIKEGEKATNMILPELLKIIKL